MGNDNVYDDPVWEYVLATKLKPYLPIVHAWWQQYDNIKVLSTGIYPLELDGFETPPGLMVRVAISAVKSPIKNVQVFPFVPAAYLQIVGVTGGVNGMIERVCAKGLELEGLMIIEKHNVRTYGKGHMLCFVPKDILSGAQTLGKFVYLTANEACAIAKGTLPQSVQAKCYQFIK